MKTNDFSKKLLVDQSPEKVFNAISHPRTWWSEEIEGVTNKLDGEFMHRYKDVHICKLKVVEFIPGKKIVWLVTENYFNFTKDSREWTGTKISFELGKKGNKTEVRFTHIGLVPQYECFDICSDAWTNYIEVSLHELITTGKGQPNPKEGGFNQQMVDEYNIGQEKK